MAADHPALAALQDLVSRADEADLRAVHGQYVIGDAARAKARAALPALEALIAERDELAAWKDEAVRSCQERQCVTRDRRLREAETERDELVAALEAIMPWLGSAVEYPTVRLDTARLQATQAQARAALARAKGGA